MVVKQLVGGEDIHVLYGHLDVKTIPATRGQTLSRGEFIGYLGDDHSDETDGVRKHLHLSIHPGAELEFRGYIQNVDELKKWLDPEQFS